MDFLLGLWLLLFGQTVQIKHTTTTTYENVNQAIVRLFGSEARLARSVFMAESKLNPLAVGDSGQSVGVAQIHLPAHAGKIPATDKVGWLKNFQNNLKLAKQIKDKSGWFAWTQFTSGAYRLYF